MQHYLGIDPGLTSAGWSCLTVEETRLSNVSFGEWRSPANSKSLWHRSHHLQPQIEQSLSLFPSGHLSAAVETSGYGNPNAINFSSFFRGLLSSAFMRYDITDITDVASATWKKAIVGDGRAKKAAVIEKAAAIARQSGKIGEKPSNALCIAYWLWQQEENLSL